MYNKEAILIPTTSICEDVRGAIARTFESTLETLVGVYAGEGHPVDDGSLKFHSQSSNLIVDRETLYKGPST